jgi:hypothetical protein
LSTRSRRAYLATLVSPTPADFEPLPAAPRPISLDGAHVGLVDSMLNPRADWGTGILDAVAEALNERWPRCTTDRIRRPQMGVHEPDRWAKFMADRHAALVIAVGD